MKNEIIPKFDFEECLLITSEPRSGSTWLMELIKAQENVAINWEPLQTKKGIIPPEWRWGRRPYLPETEDSPLYFETIRDSFTLRKYSDWTFQFNKEDEIRSAKRVLTKSVRFNLLLPWFTSNFKIKCKPIYVLRHPVATCISQIKSLYYDKRPQLDYFEIPAVIHNERYLPHLDYLNSLRTHLERWLALWFINSIPTLKHPNHGKNWHVVYYEDLKVNPESEFTRIMKWTNISYSKVDIGFDVPSATDFKRDFRSDPREQVEKWVSMFTKRELKNLQKVFDYFNFDMYRASQPYPEKLANHI